MRHETLTTTHPLRTSRPHEVSEPQTNIAERCKHIVDRAIQSKIKLHEDAGALGRTHHLQNQNQNESVRVILTALTHAKALAKADFDVNEA